MSKRLIGLCVLLDVFVILRVRLRIDLFAILKISDEVRRNENHRGAGIARDALNQATGDPARTIRQRDRGGQELVPPKAPDDVDPASARRRDPIGWFARSGVPGGVERLDRLLSATFI